MKQKYFCFLIISFGLYALFAMTLKAHANNENPGHVMVGAIRWDAWHLNPEIPSSSPALKPHNIASVAYRWFERLPFYTTLNPDGQWVVDSNTQETADREIDFAVSRGIDFWEFNYTRFATLDYKTGKYPPLADIKNNWMKLSYSHSNSLDLYLSSTRAKKPKFCLILGTGALKGYLNDYRPKDISVDQAWSNVLNDLRHYLSNPNYHKTTDGRPILIFIEQPSKNWLTIWGNDESVARQRLDELKRILGPSGPQLFIAVMNWQDQVVSQELKMGMDSVTAYALTASDKHVAAHAWSFEQVLESITQSYKHIAQSHADIIPMVPAGWDYRPIIGYDPGRSPTGDWYDLTSEQIITLLDNAIKFVKDHPQQSKANSVVIYAWNELEEGGYIVPTLQNGSQRLDAIADYLGINIAATGVPSLPGVIMPKIDSSGRAGRCQDGYGILLIGSNFDPDSYVELRAANSNDIPEGDVLIARYKNFVRGENQARQQTFSLCLTGDAERNLFASHGLNVSVVDPHRPSTSNVVFVQKAPN